MSKRDDFFEAAKIVYKSTYISGIARFATERVLQDGTTDRALEDLWMKLAMNVIECGAGARLGLGPVGTFYINI